MRVTHVITRLILGGAQENTLATVLGLAKKPDIDVDLIAGPTTGPEGSLEHLIDKNRLTIVPELVRPVHPLKDWKALVRLTEIFRSTRPQIVHTHSGKAGILGRLAARRAGVPVILHTLHGPSFGAFQGAMANWIFKTAERIAAQSTTHYISVAQAMTNQYLAAGIGTPQQYTRIFSGFTLDTFLTAKNDFSLRAKLGIQPDDFVVGKIARLFKLKGHDDLLDIAPQVVRKCPHIKFLLIGDGPWRQRLQNRARAAGLEKNIIFTGLIPPVEIPRYIGIMDALVHLSRREGLPRALSQSLAAARPVIAYDCDGAGEVCRNGGTGFLIPPGDLTLLKQRLIQLAADAHLRLTLGQNGQAFVKENFSATAMVDTIYDLYLILCKKRRADA